ncbi:YueI family protein [Niallia sp. Krafla_26]|uniref:YueI family protein n=1 Tax=Niallia sp. Krafla_26 TaxID=3064703 RepID=UPI003D17A3EB
MSESKLEEYLNQGMYGPKEINPDERRQFLGTLRERIEIALTKAQVMEKDLYKEVEQAMKRYPKLQLLLNGEIDYRFLSKYIGIANQNQIPFTIVRNQEHQTEIGLVLTHEDAVNKDEIYVTKKDIKVNIEPQPKKKKGLFSFFKKRK